MTAKTFQYSRFSNAVAHFCGRPVVFALAWRSSSCGR
jgi:low affinity Fe/Cu permease